MEIVNAVWIPRVRILSTLIMIMIVMYFFSIISFVFLYKDFNSNLSNSCKGLFECSITIFDVWYKADGAIGGFLGDNYSSLTQGEDEYNPDTFRIIYDSLFNFLVAILLVEILSGIIIDTFSSIREKRESLEEKQNSMCFVCGKKREEIPDFKSHTKYVHNIWDYLYYFGYIQNKQILENGIEVEILRMLKEKDQTLFPCFALKEETKERDMSSQHQELIKNIQIKLKEDNSELKKDVSEVKRDVSELKDTISGLKENISGLKVDNSELKDQMKEMKEMMKSQMEILKIIGK